MRRSLILFLLFLLPATIRAQVKGRVMQSDGKQQTPVLNAAVRDMSGKLLANTDANGRFVLSNPTFPLHIRASWRDLIPDTLFVEGAGDTLPDFILRIRSTDALIIRAENGAGGMSRRGVQTVEVLGKDEFKKAACCNLSESFETNASVEVSNADGISGIRQVEMLGLAGKYVQMNRDNVPLIRGLAQVNGLNQVPGPFVSRVLIAKGAGSVMNGPEGLTGSINYAFRTDRNEPPWFFNVYAGNMGRFEANAMHRVEVSPRSWYTGFVHGSAQTGTPDMNHDGFSDVPAGRKFLFGNHFQMQKEKYEMQAGLNLVSDRREAGQIVRRLHHPYTQLPYVFAQNDRKAEGFVKLGIFLNEETESSIGNIAAFQLQDLDADFGDSNLYRGQQRSFMYNFFFQREMRGEDVFRAGMNMQYDAVLEYLGPNDARIDLLPHQRQEWVAGPFAEYTLKQEKFSAVAGIRADWNNIYGAYLTPRLHLRYDLNEDNLLRFQAGYGRRTAWVLAENLPLFISKRRVEWQQQPFTGIHGKAYGFDQEKAANFGFSYTRFFKMFLRKATLHLDYFETRFDNQVLADRDIAPDLLLFHQRSGGVARTAQAEWILQPARRIDLKLAYRWVESLQPLMRGMLLQPQQSPHRIVIVNDVATRSKWHLNNTFQVNSPRRIPGTSENPAQFRRPEYSPWFVVWNAQIRKEWKGWDWYIGGENLLSAGDRFPVVSPDNPYSRYFDASLVWGPVMGANFYAGVKLSIK